MQNLHARIRCWSLDGGSDRPSNLREVIKQAGTARYTVISGVDVITDKVIRVVTSSSAGYGDSKRRDIQAAAGVLKNGIVAAQYAQEVYDP